MSFCGGGKVFYSRRGKVELSTAPVPLRKNVEEIRIFACIYIISVL